MRRGRRSAGGRAALCAAAGLALASATEARGQAAAADTPEVGIPPVAVDGYPRRSGIDVLHYDLAIELPRGDGAEIAGRAGILYETVHVDVDSLALDFGPLTVDSVAVDGRAAAHRHAAGRLVVEIPADPPAVRREAVIWYHGIPEDGLIARRNRHGERVFFADNWAVRARLWFPAIDHPSDKATVAFTVTAPEGLEVVANGTLREVAALDDGRTRWRWAESAQIPTYCMVIGAADFAVTEAGVVDGVEVSHWTYAPDSAAGEAAFARSTEILAFYDSLFGPYPYEKLAHVQSTTRYGGMENASAIFYDEVRIGEALAEGAGRPGEVADGLTTLVAHETVHQWFGDAVTEIDWHHLWLSEGFATYFAAVFFEFHGGSRGRGPEELARRMAAMTADVIEYAAGSGEPIYAPASGAGDYTHLLNANNYDKGAWVLHMLRRHVGDDAFFEGVRDYYATLRDGTAWTADFERVLEEASGLDLGWFFAQWVGRAGHPVLEVEHEPAGAGRARVVVRQIQPGDPFRFPLDLALSWPGGDRREAVEVASREAEFTFDTGAAVTAIEVDPDDWLLHERAATRAGRAPGR